MRVDSAAVHLVKSAEQAAIPAISSAQEFNQIFWNIFQSTSLQGFVAKHVWTVSLTACYHLFASLCLHMSSPYILLIQSHPFLFILINFHPFSNIAIGQAVPKAQQISGISTWQSRSGWNQAAKRHEHQHQIRWFKIMSGNGRPTFQSTLLLSLTDQLDKRWYLKVTFATGVPLLRFYKFLRSSQKIFFGS